ncbi:discoidin domain-containing protein [Lysinibacillus xylanilyticus]|uniref:discoidin domain-containing protein n=1 Tax=Lysinibacillus xylanilyticus TaxID=582475 RepID=UPI0037F6FD67
MKYVDILPTSNGKGTSSETVDGFTYYLSNYNMPVGRGFDKNPATAIRSGIDGTGYVEITFPKNYLIGKYSITLGYHYSNGDMKTWKIEARVNGAWVVVHNGSHPNPIITTYDFEFTPVLADSLKITVLSRHSGNSFGFAEFSLYELVYDSSALVYHNGTYKTYNEKTLSWESLGTGKPSKDVFLSNGVDMYLRSDFSIFDAFDSYELIYLSDNPSVSYVKAEQLVEPYSVYDYISELPEVLVYTETTDDIEVSTTTEPFDIYDEFGDSVEVLYYTDDEAVKEADLILEANWSPLDELEGDFEVVTWTDEAPESAQRVLELKAVPKPQFIKLTSPKRVYGELDDVLVNDISQSYRDEARYFVAGEQTNKWYAWNKLEGKFVVVDTSTEQAIMKNGMTQKKLNAITSKQWRTWNSEYLNIGMFLVDNSRDTIKTIVETVSFEDYIPRNTSTIKDTSLYILNTTAKIDISFDGNVLKGILSDDDLTRVQYRVILNNGSFYPSDGSFTKLGESPQNIELAIGSKDIRIDDWNTLKVEFQDFYGTVDYWSTQFIGTYSGLMFKDIYGKYFSSEIGEVLQYLDFGIIIAGQTTIEHEIVLKNQYGYDVKDIQLFANTSNFPQGMTIEFSTNQSPFIPQPDLKLSGVLKNNEEMPFFIRLKTELGATPDVNGSFDIIVRAERA